MLQRSFFGDEFDAADRFRVEILDADVLVLDRRHHLVHRVPGELVDHVLRGGPGHPDLLHLPPEALPVLREAVRGTRVARRRVLISGGALAVGGILTSALPFAAAAASRYLTLTGESVDTYTLGGATSVNKWGAAELQLSAIADGRIQVLLQGTQGGTGGTGTTGSPGLGNYMFVEVENLPADNSNGNLTMSLRQGGEGGYLDVSPVAGGDGGMAAFLYLQILQGPSNPPVLTMIAAAAGGGGASGSGDGGDAALATGGNGTSPDGEEARGGAGGTTAAGGSGGVLPDGENYFEGGFARAGGTTASSDQFVENARSNPAWSYGGIASNRRAGGGGGAGFQFGGGGAPGSTAASGPYPVDAGGGGGGASYTKTATTGPGDPYVTSQRVFSTARTLEAGALLEIYYVPA